MEESCYFLDLQDYLYAIGYEINDDYSTTNSRYFENYSGSYVIVSYQGNGKVTAFLLRRVLSEINRKHEDFTGYLKSKEEKKSN